jgi:hypothetical protein
VKLILAAEPFSVPPQPPSCTKKKIVKIPLGEDSAFSLIGIIQPLLTKKPGAEQHPQKKLDRISWNQVQKITERSAGLCPCQLGGKGCPPPPVQGDPGMRKGRLQYKTFFFTMKISKPGKRIP